MTHVRRNGMASFGEMWQSMGIFIVVWILWTLALILKALRCGTYFMNKENLFFVGYVGFTIGILVTAILSLMRL